MQRPDDCILAPGQLANIRREAERALREAGALGVFPTPIDRIMSVANVEEVAGGFSPKSARPRKKPAVS